MNDLLNVELQIATYNNGWTMIPCPLFKKVKIKSTSTARTYTLANPSEETLQTTNSTSYGDEIDISGYDYVLMKNNAGNQYGYVMFTG